MLFLFVIVFKNVTLIFLSDVIISLSILTSQTPNHSPISYSIEVEIEEGFRGGAKTAGIQMTTLTPNLLSLSKCPQVLSSTRHKERR
jgi:hypothetical protein